MEARVANNDPDADVVSVFRRIEGSRIPSIAVVHGDAYAGGCELALHCDLRIASESARFCMPLAKVGIMLALPLVQKLVEIVGAAFTRQILLTGSPISGQRACEIGMVHGVVPAADLEAATSALARTVAGNAPLSLGGLKLTIARAISAREQITSEDLQALALQARASADAREGRLAILEKRRPVFQGR
jgi:enoyl-CoA hydratase/carnithine racemase